MSSVVNNLGTFDPNRYKNNGTGGKSKQRMAGDNLIAFTNSVGNDGQKYRTNTERMLFGNSSNTSNKASSQKQAKSKPATPSAINKNTAVIDPNNKYNNKNADGSYKSAVHEFAESQGYDQDAFLTKKYGELDTYINNYEGPTGFSDDSNLSNNNDTAGRASNIMQLQQFKNSLKERSQIQRQLNTSQGLDPDSSLPEDPNWYKEKKANQIAGQNAAIANGNKPKERAKFIPRTNKMTDYTDAYAKANMTFSDL